MEKLTKSQMMPEFSPKNIQSDLIHFKEDILKDFRSIKLSLIEKYSIVEENLKEKINKFDSTIKSFEQKILELSKLILIDQAVKEKVEALSIFKEESRDSFFKHRAKFYEFENRMNKEIDRINGILSNLVIYPGIIGGNAKFKNFHEFIDFVLKEIGEISIMKDKNGLDLKPFKKRIEQTIDSFRIQMNNIYTKEMTNNAINNAEERIQNSLKLYEEKIMNLKVDNYSTNLNYTNKLEELNSKLNSFESFQKNLEFNSDILYIKKEISTIYKILRDLFSDTEIKGEIERKSKVYSGVKQYINGILNAEQLSFMKKFSYNKTNTYWKIREKNNSEKISPFPSPEKIKNKNNYDKRKLLFNTSKSYNNNEFGFDKHTINKSNSKTNNVLISQKGFMKRYPNDIKEIDENEKLINNNCTKEKNNSSEKINLDNRIQKIYKDEDPLIRKFNIVYNNTYETKNSKNKIEKKGNINQCIISEEDENILSDNAYFLQEKLIKVKSSKLYNNPQSDNTNNISFEVFKKNKAITPNPKEIQSFNQNYKETEIDDFLIKSDNSKQNSIDTYIQKKSNMNKFKLVKEKDYNQSVPSKIMNSKKENVFAQSNESRFIKSNILGIKTYTSSFPKIKKEIIPEIKPYKNSTLEKNKFTGLIINENSYEVNNKSIQSNHYKKKKRKALLINPNLLSNFELRKHNKSVNSLKSVNRPNNVFRKQKNIDKMVNEMIKGLVIKKKNNIITKRDNIQAYNSLYDIINAHEHTFESNRKSKNKKQS